MKVKIGKYPNTWWTCQIHSNYMDRKYGIEWKESETKFEKFLEKLESAIQWFYNNTVNHIVKHRKRKISVRIDREDTWSMDHTLAYINLLLKAPNHLVKNPDPLCVKLFASRFNLFISCV